MKTKLLAAATAALGMLFSVNAVSAATYTIDIDYNLMDGTICGHSNICGTVFGSSLDGSPYIPVNLPTLYAGDVIDTTINFTRGLALTINASSLDRQGFGVTFFANNSANEHTLSLSQLSLTSRTWRSSDYCGHGGPRFLRKRLCGRGCHRDLY
jgi:hypothetical protein